MNGYIDIEKHRQMILDNTRINPETGCWEWTKFRDPLGYARIHIRDRVFLVHRVSYFVFIDEIPNDMDICHRCDNPSCCNPDHLFPGTHSDNMRDMVRKGRRKENYQPRGEDNGLSKLTEVGVLEIRRLYETGKYTQKELGKMFGVNQSLISRIVLKKLWGYI